MWKLVVVIALFGASILSTARAQDKDEQRATTVTGVLSRIAAIGGETTGWAVRFESETTVEGKRLRLIEVSYDTGKLTMLEDKRVRASGRITSRRGIERGEWLVLEINSIEEIKPK